MFVTIKNGTDCLTFDLFIKLFDVVNNSFLNSGCPVKRPLLNHPLKVFKLSHCIVTNVRVFTTAGYSVNVQPELKLNSDLQLIALPSSPAVSNTTVVWR